jgi:hypothetical protein
MTEVRNERVPTGRASVESSAAAMPSREGNLPLAFLAHFVAIATLALGVGAWFLHYTAKFEMAASLYALTSVSSWIAVASKLVPQAPIVALQSAADQLILNSWIFLGLVALVSAGFFRWADGGGTLD